ncbi:MAG: hypothetical protein AAF685_04570 [Cyanobacteria bacterium P01_C01_bin.89]
MTRYRNSSKTGPSIALYIVGVALVVAAALIILNGLGVLSAIPGYVYGAIALVVLGVGILSGLNRSR